MVTTSIAENAIITLLDLLLLLLVTIFLLPSVTELIIVFGGFVFTVHMNAVGVGPSFPALSSDLTSKVWDPSGRLLNCTGLVHVVNDAPSREHSKWSNPTPISVPENVNVMDSDVVLPLLVTVLLLPSLAEFIVVSGGVASTFQVKSSGEVSLFPELSTALTLNVCGPLLNKSGNVNGLVQAANSELSILHSKPFTPPLLVSEPENVNVIEFDRVLLSLDRVFLLLSTTESIDVVGGRVSIVQANDAGDTSTLTTLSSDLTFKVWDPSGRLLNCTGLVHVVNDAPSMRTFKVVYACTHISTLKRQRPWMWM